MDASVSDICQKPPVNSANAGARIGLDKDITNLYDLVILLRMLAIARDATGTPDAEGTITYYGAKLSKTEFPQAHGIYISIHNRDQERSATIKIKETIIELAKRVNSPSAVLDFNPAASDYTAWFHDLTSARLEALRFKTPANQAILREIIKLAKMLEIARAATGNSSTPRTMSYLGGLLSGQKTDVDGNFDVYMSVHAEKIERSATQKVKLTIKKIWDILPGGIKNLIPGISDPVKDLNEAKVADTLKKLCAAPPPSAPAPAPAPAPKPTPPVAIKPDWRMLLAPRVEVIVGANNSTPEKPVPVISRPAAGLSVELGSEDPDVSAFEFQFNKKPVTVHPRAYFESSAYRGAGGLPVNPPFNARWGTGAKLNRKLSKADGALSLDLKYRGSRVTADYPTMDRPSGWENGLAGRLELALKRGPLSKLFFDAAYDRSTWEAWNTYTARVDHPNFTGDRFALRLGGEGSITEKLSVGGAFTFGQQDLPRYAPALGYAEPEQVPVWLNGLEIYGRYEIKGGYYLRGGYVREGLEGFPSTHKITLGGDQPLGKGQLSANLFFRNHPTHFSPVDSPFGAEAVYRRALYQSSRPWVPNVEAQVSAFYDNLSGQPDNFGGLGSLLLSLPKPAKPAKGSASPSPFATDPELDK